MESLRGKVENSELRLWELLPKPDNLSKQESCEVVGMVGRRDL